MDGKKKIRILVAEDDANVLQTVAVMFEANGYDVKTAADASGVRRKRF